MYLSAAYMRRKTTGERAFLSLLAYMDAYRLQESELAMTITAISRQLEDIIIMWPETEPQAKFNLLFQIQDNELIANVKELRELCLNLRQKN